jgi:pseudouridine synthase
MSDDRTQGVKLFRFLQTQAGVSRRKAIDLIRAGEVAVNSRPIVDPFLVLEPNSAQHLALRGHPLSLEPLESRIYRFHKPAGMLCSHDDPFCGNTVGRLLRGEGFLGYTWVGRLDQDAEGLLLLSNDGDVIQAFTHPRYEVRKVYHVWVAEPPSERDFDRALRAMERGIEDEGETLRILEGRVDGRPRRAVVTLAEGRKHEIKRLFARFGLSVNRLVRVAVGPVQLGDLAPSACERLPLSDEAALLADARRRLAEAGDMSDRDLLADGPSTCRQAGDRPDTHPLADIRKTRRRAG